MNQDNENNFKDIFKDKYINELSKVSGVEIRAFPLHPHVPPGIKYEMPVLFQVLTGPLPADTKRDPINLCITLDRSGSMKGPPLENCKKAIIDLVSKLSDDDIVHLVTYDSQVSIVFDHMRKENLDQIIEKVGLISAGATTNISGGLEKSVELLNGSECNYDKIVFLFSDGNANQGITSLDVLGKLVLGWVKSGIKFSSFGIGVEYNEEWLRAISRSGQGNYFFIDDVENVPKIVDKGLAGFANIVAENVKFRVYGKSGKLVSLNGSSEFETLAMGCKLSNLRENGLIQFMGLIDIDSNSPIGRSRFIDCSLILDPTKKALGHVSNTYAIRLEIDYSYDIDLLMASNDQVLCFEAITSVGKLGLDVEQALRENRVGDALKMKKDVIEILELVVDLDEFGIVQQMYKREKESYALIEKEGGSARAIKYQNAYANVAAGAAKCIKKASWEEDESEDGDMGFSLFD
jgi:uncharacterized protein YegL